MKIAMPLALLLAAGCAATPRPYAPVANVRYQALGAEPFWMLTIGDDRIVLRRPDGEAVWPRSLPRTTGGARIWESGEGANVITVETRPGPCTSESEQVYEDQVRVRLSGTELNGCGGRLVRRARR